MKKQSIAIIGSGISGLSCAYFLSDKFDVKVFEKNNYFGGHSNTVEINYSDKKIAVDTGFIVFNHQTYPNLKAFFELMKVDYEKSNMSFAVKINNSKLEYAGTNLATVFAQTKNILNFKFLRMLLDIVKFNKKAESILQKEFNPNYTLKNLIDDLNLGDYFKKYYLLPMSGAIWSCPLETMLSYPAQSFVRFFKNHGLLTVANQPQWFTVTGGSKEYVKKIINKVGEENFLLNNEVISVSRQNEKISVQSKSGEILFDHVIFACHGDQVLKILHNPEKLEKEILSNFKYQTNLAVLHRDTSVMPKSKKTWSSWVYSNNQESSESNIAVSYWMNNLQNIDHNYPLFVTLNPNQEIDSNKIFAQFNYEHPIFDSSAVSAQEKISEIQGSNRIYFCGAYQKYGFHEDGISSAISVINKLGIFTPWQ
ncbi:MAG: FAD-dependent oxidoreductase [Pelagibacterales bacterium]|nr:FAD-dependent oxidoreductase [Pelagibacterales bacterium]